MRVTIDRGAEAVRIEFGAAADARRTEVADDVAILADAAGRVVAIEVRGVDPAALQAFTVELAGLADRPAVAAPAESALPPPAAARDAPAAPPFYTGPLTWEPEAEAAILQVPFFSRGQRRLDASALARRRGSDRVTVDIVQASGRR